MRCANCKLDKPIEEFVGVYGRPRKVCSRCASHRKAYDRLRYDPKHPRGNRTPEGARKDSRLWRSRNPERKVESDRLYRENNREKRRVSGRAWHEANKKKINLKSADYRKNNPDKDVEYKHRRRARLSGASGGHSSEDIRGLLEQQNSRCEACRIRLAVKGKRKYHVDHMVPLSRGGSDDVSNLQLLCQTCNQRKHAMPYEDWCSRLGRLPLTIVATPTKAGKP